MNMHEVGGLFVLIWIISHTINLALKEKIMREENSWPRRECCVDCVHISIMLYSGNFDSNKSPPVSLGTRKHTHTHKYSFIPVHTLTLYIQAHNLYPHTYIHVHTFYLIRTWLSMYRQVANTGKYSTVHALLSLVSRPIGKIGLGMRLMHYYVQSAASLNFQGVCTLCRCVNIQPSWLHYPHCQASPPTF